MDRDQLLSEYHELRETAPKFTLPSQLSSIVIDPEAHNRPRISIPRKPIPASNTSYIKSNDIKGWPSSPQSLKKTGWAWWSAFLVHVLMILCPLPFLVLAISLAANNGRPTSDRMRWDALQNSIKVSASLFPIVFATLGGRAVMKIATYRLERGVALGKLDQLVGSRTLGSMIATHYHLGSYNTLGLGLLVLWSMSPIGGQAILRVQTTNFKLKATPTTFTYFNTDTASQATVMIAVGPDNASGVSAWFARIASLYTTTLLGPETSKGGPLDLWGNVKIPFLSSYEGSLDGSWSELPNDTSLFYYSALAGIPISEIPLGTTNFSIESSYMETKCQNITYRAQEIDYLSEFDYHDSVMFSSSNGTYRGSNWTQNTSPSFGTTPDATWTLGLDNFVAPAFSIFDSSYGDSQGYMGSPSQLPRLSDEQVSTGTLFFQAIDPADNAPKGSPTSSTAGFCKLQQVYVESNISCMQGSTMPARLCSVTAQRLSQKYHPPSAITPLSFPQVFSAISLNLPRAFGVDPSGGGSDPSIFYLNSTSTVLMTSGSVSSETNGHAQTAIIYNVPQEILSYRLAQIINTYLLLTQTGTLITGGTPSSSGILLSSNVTAVSTTPFEVYTISWTWLAVFIFSTLVLFTCANHGIGI